MRIAVERFAGEVPRLAPRLLGDSQAQVAMNCHLGSGDLRPWNALALARTLPTADSLQTIHLAGGGSWLGWPADVDVVPFSLPEDSHGRLYLTGLDAPRVTDLPMILAGQGAPAPATYRLGIPAPAQAPEVGLGAGGTEDPRSLSYVYTFVSAWSEEGPPSPPSSVIEARPGQAVTISAWDAAPAGDYQITKRRIYRTNTPSAGSALWQFVAEVDVGDTSRVDTVADAELGETLQSASWYPPPASLRGLTALPNNFFAGFAGNELCFSEPYYPHAWPEEYRLALEFPVVGLGVYGTTLVVATRGRPYLVSGSHPASMSMSKLPDLAPCLAKRGLVSSSAGVTWPTPDGLFSVGPGGAGLITRELFTRDEWQALHPETLHAAVHDGRYIAFYRQSAAWDGAIGSLGGSINETAVDALAVNASAVTWTPPRPASGGGLIFDRAESLLSFLDFYAGAAHVEPTGDALYLMIQEDGGPATVRAWDAGPEAMPFKWRSKEFRTSSPVNFASARVLAEHDPAAPIIFRVYADGRLRREVAVSNDLPFRLPGGFRAKVWEIEIEGTVPVQAVLVATSTEELANG